MGVNGVIHRISKRLWLDKSYCLDTFLVNGKTMAELGDDDDDEGFRTKGLWLPKFEERPCVGHIYLLDSLSLAHKWETWRHELVHALNDLGNAKKEGIL